MSFKKLIVLSFCLLFSGNALAQLYAAVGNVSAEPRAFNLYIIDPATGDIIETIGDTGWPITGLDFHPITGELYATSAYDNFGVVAGDDDTGWLLRIDPATAQVTPIAQHDDCAIVDISFAADGTLYGWRECQDVLVTIDLQTAVTTEIGPDENTARQGMDFAPDGRLFMFGEAPGYDESCAVVELDPSNGTKLGAVALDPCENIPGGTHDSAGTLWVATGAGESQNTARELATLDTATGQLTVVGPMPDSISALAYRDVEAMGTLNVNVTKTFSNGDTGDVEVTLTCNGGIPLQQSFTISGGGPGVTFTVTNLPDGGADCAVTESGGNEGYTADLSACSWTGVTGGSYSCAIENVPEPTEVTVETAVEGEADPSIDTSFTTTIVCENVSPDTGSNFITVTVEDTTGLFEADWYPDPDLGTDCTVTMVPVDNAVEGDSCTFSFEIGDEEAGCDVAGTVFFEGIPTLSQYGLALMALLMLGIGFVGMRRFV